ncbi:hypothetical protein, partial [uncultured Ruminococcus sp.]|uniref:hypothetical protein n=1 Tax=uncultured Ruminococcus sp. TaxID=165186 RepID=UPI002621F860
MIDEIPTMIGLTTLEISAIIYLLSRTRADKSAESQEKFFKEICKKYLTSAEISDIILKLSDEGTANQQLE